MTLHSETLELLQSTESSLRKLIAQHAESSEFEELQLVVAACEQIRNISSNWNSLPSQTASSSMETERKKISEKPYPQNTEKRKTKKRVRKKQYPKFHASGKHLIKVGWSKTNKAEYEHKAPMALIEDVCQAISLHANPNGSFFMDTVLGSLAEQVSNPPNYQSYLILAWLKQSGLVTQLGKGEYKCVRENLTDAANSFLQELLS